MNVLNHKYGLIISLFIWLSACVFLQAADPTGLINYQGRLLDKYGRRVNTPVEIIFRIFNNNNDLLWSEKQDSIPVTDGLYSTILGSVTPLPASIFNSDEVYFEIGINGETLTPRQRITAAPFALTARQATGFKMPAGASAGYVLTSDGDGVGHWQAIAQITNGSDSITNWAQAVFKPATNALWTAVIQRVLIADYSTATGELWNAVNARLPLSGGTMTGPVTNNAGFFGRFSGDGAGLTNVSGAGFTDTGAVHKIGDTMTGPLVVSNNLTVSGGTTTMTGPLIVSSNLDVTGPLIVSNNLIVAGGTTMMTGPLIVSNNLIVAGPLVASSNLDVSGNVTWRPGSQTIADNSTTIQVAQAFAKIGTDGSPKDFSGCALQIAPGLPGQMLIIQATNSVIKLSDGKGVKLAEGVSFTMSTNDTLQLIYDGSNWIELHRADND